MLIHSSVQTPSGRVHYQHGTVPGCGVIRRGALAAIGTAAVLAALTAGTTAATAAPLSPGYTQGSTGGAVVLQNGFGGAQSGLPQSSSGSTPAQGPFGPTSGGLQNGFGGGIQGAMLANSLGGGGGFGR